MQVEGTGLVRRLRSYSRRGSVPAMRRDCGETSLDNRPPNLGITSPDHWQPFLSCGGRAEKGAVMKPFTYRPGERGDVPGWAVIALGV
jgi:hypothetical protein